jgi:uncharacterized protein (TIGR02284 family)
MSNATHVEKVASIIKVLNGGIEFYSDAIKKVDSQKVKDVFNTVIREKQSAVDKLQPFAVSEKGEYEHDNSMAVDTRNMYTRLISTFSSDSDHTFVSQLEEVEDKTLDVIRDALDEDQPEDCRSVLKTVMADMSKCHNQMKTLQNATS